MTYSFIQAMQNGNELTYGRLLNAMRHTIHEASTRVRLKGPIASLVNKVLGAGLTQVRIILNNYSRFAPEITPIRFKF